MVNRVGDFGFLTGIILLYYAVSVLPAFQGNGLDFLDLASFYRSDPAGSAGRGFDLREAVGQLRRRPLQGFAEDLPLLGQLAPEEGKQGRTSCLGRVAPVAAFEVGHVLHTARLGVDQRADGHRDARPDALRERAGAR